MIPLLWVSGYLVIGIVVAMLGLWLDVCDFTAFGNEIDWMPVALAVMGWPLAIVAGIATICLRATLKAKKERTKIRQELEREAKKAAEAVEDFLRSAR